MIMNKRKNTNALPTGRQGFILIELLVAMAIFVVVITVVFDLFSSAIRGQRRVIAMQNTQENARFMLEFMAKEIRMSEINGGDTNSLDITRSNGDAVHYLLSNGKLYQNDIQVNSDEISVDGGFYIVGIGEDGLQPRVTIVFKVQGVGSRPEEQAFMNVQTTLSQRVLDSSDL